MTDLEAARVEGAEDVAAIAAGLTKAQRAMVLTDDKHFASHAKGHWHGTSIVVGRKLFELGLINSPGTLRLPTPLGLAVRAHLTTGATHDR